MCRFLMVAIAIPCLALVSQTSTIAQDGRDALQGVWVGETMEVDGKMLPTATAMRMRFDFKDGKLFMKGNFRDDRVEDCTFKVDPKQSPKHFEFTPPKQENAVLGIYELTKDVLKVCMRRPDKAGGRPTEFKTKEGEGLILLVLRKQKS